MKIIVVTETLDGDNKEGKSTLEIIKEPLSMLKSDSSLLKGGRPLFLPDFSAHFSVGVHLVVCINKLGKSIPRKFAHRYYSTVTIGLDVQADDVVEELSKEGKPWKAGADFDGSAVVGRFVPAEKALAHTVTLFADGEKVVERNVGNWAQTTDGLIESLSRYSMLREGDLLYCGATAPRFPLCIGQHLQAELDGNTVLDFHIR